VRIYPDVIVEPHGDNEWSAMGREAAVIGETLILNVVHKTSTGEPPQRVQVCVIDSHPILLDGDLRHWIRLRRGTLAPIAITEQVRPS